MALLSDRIQASRGNAARSGIAGAKSSSWAWENEPAGTGGRSMLVADATRVGAPWLDVRYPSAVNWA